MTQRLRVLFVTNWYPSQQLPSQGVFVREHAKAVQIYADVVVLHLAGHDGAAGGGVRVEAERDTELNDGIRTFHAWHRRLPVPNASYPAYIWAAVQAGRIIERTGFRPNLVHAHIYSAGLPAAAIARWRRIPMVITEHSSAFPRRLLSPRQIRLARLAFAQARLVMPVSEALRHAIEAYGIRAAFQIVPNAVDTSIFHPAVENSGDAGRATRHASMRLLFVGGMVPVKGIPDLLQALSFVNETRRDWQLDLVGSGPNQADYATLASQLGLDHQTRFHGFLPKPAVAALMRQADFLVLPSLWENSPCVIVEALASGLPVIASRVGGVPELMTAQAGILTTPQDPASLATALTAAMANPQQFDRRVLVQMAQRYTPATVGREIDAVYRSVQK